MLEFAGGLVASLVLAAIPALPILVILRRLDRDRPEPLGLVGTSVLYGFATVVPAAVLELLLSGILPPLEGLSGHLIDAFVVVALVEEGTKLAFLRRYLWKRREFDEAADGIVYAVSLSLGFAIVENFLYTWNDPGLLILRSVTAVPLHAIATGSMGYWLGREKLGVAGGGWGRGLLVAVAFHGIYDFFLLEGGLLALMIFPLLVAGGIVLRRHFAMAKALDDGRAQDDSRWRSGPQGQATSGSAGEGQPG
jgi:RsiW-degrading membrane proteinase PrsW (M82 family)